MKILFAFLFLIVCMNPLVTQASEGTVLCHDIPKTEVLSSDAYKTVAYGSIKINPNGGLSVYDWNVAISNDYFKTTALEASVAWENIEYFSGWSSEHPLVLSGFYNSVNNNRLNTYNFELSLDQKSIEKIMSDVSSSFPTPNTNGVRLAVDRKFSDFERAQLRNCKFLPNVNSYNTTILELLEY